MSPFTCFSSKNKPPAMQVCSQIALASSKNLQCYNKCRFANRTKTKEVSNMDKNSLAHTRWECKYHIVFAPKYRRKVIYQQIRVDVAHILSELCKRKGIEIIEAEACPDHIHMFVRIPPKYSVSQIMGYLKGKSSLMIFDRHANPKYKYGNRHFWARGYYVDTVGRNKKQIQEYIKNQLTEDRIADQIGMKEFVDPFTGSVNQKA